jgi:NAD(P)-dependent dehydrogenase (short-subunit alcohol dehydrogenase family)
MSRLSRALAIEYASRGLRVNAVALGVIKTPTHDESSYAGMGALHPIGRVGEIEDVVGGSPISRVGALRDRRDPAHRRRPKRRILTMSAMRGATRDRSGKFQKRR